MSNPNIPTLRTRADGAVLAAAVGDALGWPQEDRRRRSRTSPELEPRFEFSSWIRREGGRFASHEIEIGAGEYSDDTQLILALAHALYAEDQWWDRWTSIELPFWLLYERGGGSASKRAARSWSRGKPPWLEADNTKYFESGGNGVAMRVLPHCLRGANYEDFSPIATAVVKDGITTHGHPVAHIGALVYAYALWEALRSSEPLAYGELIALARESVNTWSQIPEDLPHDWHQASQRHNHDEDSRLWQSVVQQMVELLDLSMIAIGQGALSVDRETLGRLGAFDKEISGAGTVTAASALFLASRYASRPAQGIVASAFCHGADTDTLASMTGGLLGAINGSDWVGGIAADLQDFDHLRATASGLIEPPNGRYQETEGRTSVRRFSERLAQCLVGNTIDLPDGRTGVLEHLRHLPTKTQNEITSFVIRTDDRQTLYITKRRRTSQPHSVPDSSPVERATVGKTAVRSNPRVAFAITVSNLEESVRFYRDLIGLRIARKAAEGIILDGGIVLVPIEVHGEVEPRQMRLMPNPSGGSRSKLVVFLAPPEFEEVYRRMRDGAAWTSRLNPTKSMREFGCIDPDGTLVEIRETRDTRI